jgi:hypothetical protein
MVAPRWFLIRLILAGHPRTAFVGERIPDVKAQHAKKESLFIRTTMATADGAAAAAPEGGALAGPSAPTSSGGRW